MVVEYLVGMVDKDSKGHIVGCGGCAALVSECWVGWAGCANVRLLNVSGGRTLGKLFWSEQCMLHFLSCL